MILLFIWRLSIKAFERFCSNTRVQLLSVLPSSSYPFHLREDMEADESETMSGTRSITPIPSRPTRQEGNFRKVKTSFQDGILQEYGCVKFSEIKDDDPLLYAYSRRPKAILQAKVLRHLDKTLGLAPHVHAEKEKANVKERRKRANRLTYENGVIGNRAVQECIRDLFIGYDVRHVSQELKLSRLRKANAQLEEQLSELMNKKRRGNSIQNDKVSLMEIRPSAVDSSNQAFGQDQSMVQEIFDGKMKEATDHLRESSSFPYQKTYPTERQSVLIAGSDQTHEINDQTMQSSANPYECQRVFSPQNQLYQHQKAYSLNNQQARGFQPHHLQLSQQKQTHQQGMSSMNNDEAFFSRSQPHHRPLNQHGGPQRVILPVNQSPQYFFPQGQISFIPGPYCNIHDHNGANQIVDLERQNGFFPVMCPQAGVDFGHHMSIAQHVNEDRNRMLLAGNPVLQNGQTQKVAPNWNASIPTVYSDNMSPNFHLAR